MKDISPLPKKRTPIYGSDIYVIPISNNCLVYSPLRHVFALVNKKAVSSIRQWLEDKVEMGNVPEPMQGLFREIQAPLQEIPEEHTGSIRPAFLGIIPSRACNLSCVYCGFGAGSAPKERMDLHMAASAVDWMAERMQRLGQEVFEIHFFGGEPFVAGEVVDVTVHRARAVADQMGLVPRFEVATNGVFDDDRARFVGDYFDTVVLSFDGHQEIHDCHRPMSRNRGSFEAVAHTAHHLSQSPVELCLRTCITKDSVRQMENTARWFFETFKPSIINFETLQPTSESEAAGLKPPDPYDFAIHCFRACRIVEANGAQAIYASASTEIPRLSFCPVGKDTLILSPDGRASSCYLPPREWKARGLDLDVGRQSRDGTMRIDLENVKRLRWLVTQKPRCERCFCRWTCAGGCHVNHSYPGCPLEYNDFCIQTRIIKACSLLNDLGLDHVAEALLQDRAALEALSLCPTDCIEDWEV
jgi:uncharacterized protein